ncbi:MAG: tryptophan synthase subunit alpha [Planctomycetota bacterium]|nr:tryptophan synthase subunit alpha [Planctomycetota bacterium]
MSRIDEVFQELRGQGRRALMPFICAGYPRRGDTSLLLPSLERAGVRIAEVGIPFSDPIADGAVIAGAMHRAIELGATPGNIFAEVAQIRPWLKMALVAMVSVSIVHRAGGMRGFVSRAKSAGFDGVLVPDLPFEESEELRGAAADAGVSCPLMISPSTPLARAEAIAKAATGFVYLLARAGLTGEQTAAPDVSGKVARLRTMTDLPIAVGFGISTAEHVRAVTRHADAAIVGSALVRRLGEIGAKGGDVTDGCERFAAELMAGLATGALPAGKA